MKKEECWGATACKQPVAWIRHTQFAGSHPFCAEHAKEERDFLVSDSTKDWEQVNEKEEAKDV